MVKQYFILKSEAAMSVKTWFFYLCFSVQDALYVKYKSEHMWDRLLPAIKQLQKKKKKRKVSGSREQGGTPLHVQRVLRETSEEAGIINNA